MTDHSSPVPFDKQIGNVPGFRIRRVLTPSSQPRPNHLKEAAPVVEVSISKSDEPLLEAVVGSSGVEEALTALQRESRDLPRLTISALFGAVDLRLEDAIGRFVKRGVVTLQHGDDTFTLQPDPSTRRFRLGSLPPGSYGIRATAGIDGQAVGSLSVRAGEVSRVALQLDGRPSTGTSTMRLRFKDQPEVESVRVKITSRDTGELLREDTFRISDGQVTIDKLLVGSLHVDIFGQHGERSCYDVDTNDDLLQLPDVLVDLEPPIRLRRPDPPPDWFVQLPEEVQGLWSSIRDLGIHTLDELARQEPEALMHKALANHVPLHSRAIVSLIEQARRNLAVVQDRRVVTTAMHVRAESSTSTSLSLEHSGEHIVSLNVGLKEANVTLKWPGGERQFAMTGARDIRIDIDKKDLGDLHVVVHNNAKRDQKATVITRFPTDSQSKPKIRSVRDHLTSIYSSLGERNPGIRLTPNDATLTDANLQGWVEHARTAMHTLGVCSIDDLGRFRMTPMQKFHAGAYVAPARVRPTFPVLDHYMFSHVINGAILRYLPNDTLHDTAVVLASEWDIRGQTVVIAADVRELLVVVHSILYDASTRITWEHQSLPAGPAYWPNSAPNGARGSSWGEAGQPGGDGDQSPSSGINGGANAVVVAPTVTMYLRDATNGLPPIDLKGQDGGTGGIGQNGGRGGDGECGLRADGTFFGGCCRGVGWGGAGGRGGKGGRGGRGGNGGNGGRVTILTTPASIAAIDTQHPVIDVNPGAGGPGGLPGASGTGGTGGPAGSADCETWCSDHPERAGANGLSGETGSVGPSGDPGPPPPSDAIQLLPITTAQWDAQFNSPHILSASPLVGEPGTVVSIVGDHFLPSTDRVYFDGVNVGPVSTASSATFTVPLDAEGGFHPVVVRHPTDSSRLSNKIMVQVIPKIMSMSPVDRWTEGTACTITGLAFRPGCQVTAEDWSKSPSVSYVLPVGTVTRTSIALNIPNTSLGGIRGVRRIVVRNPDSGTSRGEHVARIGDTIVVKVAAFRLIGSTTGVSTSRSIADITNLFTDGATHCINVPWAAARIAFELAQPVVEVSVADEIANVFPIDESQTSHPTFDTVFAASPFVPGALNILFARDVEVATAYASFGGGPIVYGDEPGHTLTAVDFQQIIAHEVGHALCLRHICDGSGEGPGTFFNRMCQGSDEHFLMYPFWDASDGMDIDPGQVPMARNGATYVETGKTHPLTYANLFRDNVPPRCASPDTDN